MSDSHFSGNEIKDEIKVINESVVESETTEELSGFPRI